MRKVKDFKRGETKELILLLLNLITLGIPYVLVKFLDGTRTVGYDEPKAPEEDPE